MIFLRYLSKVLDIAALHGNAMRECRATRAATVFRLGSIVTALLYSPYPARAAGWSFHDAVRAAWAHDPTGPALAIAEQSARNEAHAARAWFPGGAILNAQYLDDHFIGSNQGYTTYQGQLSMPFWLPGQGSAVERNALANAEVARANLAMARMATSIQLLDVATAAATEKRLITTLTAERDAARAMAAQSDRTAAAGEAPATDRDAAHAFVNDLDQQYDEAQERLAGDRADLVKLAGSDEVPAIEAIDGRALATSEVGRTGMDVTHDPRFIYATAVAKASDAAMDVTRHSWMPTPSAGIQVVRQKQFEALWDTSVGMQVNVQLPSRAQYTPRLMQSVRAQANAERDLTRARRIITDEYAHIRSRLGTALAVQSDATARCAAQTNRERQVGHAWQVGEMPLIELLRTRQATLVACQARDTAQVAWHAALIRLMISSGQTP